LSIQRFRSIRGKMSEESQNLARRIRRQTTKAVNYAKEQDFSGDEDVFEDEADDEDKVTNNNIRRRGRPRKSTSNNGEIRMDPDENDGSLSSKPIYTEKGYDPSLPPIRERFPFLPEYEADGSPRIELIVGRRPVLNNSHSTDLLDDPIDDEDDHGGAGRRIARRQQLKASMAGGKDSLIANASEDIEYEYLLKYKGKSYLHLTWKTGHDLESMNKSAKTLYRRYLKKLAAGTEESLEDPDFDPSYIVPQKIVDEAEQEIIVELSDKELMEWEKEREKEIDDDQNLEDVKVEGIDDDESQIEQNLEAPIEESGKFLVLF
jgi:hypothetical protein